MRLTIVYDNELFGESPDLETGWGFSCLIEVGELKILFDTGWKGAALVRNLEKLDFNVEDIDLVILSHQHWDHVGGLPCVMNQGRDLKIYVPASFSANMKRDIASEHVLFEVLDATKIVDGVYSTGELGSQIKEQSIVLEGSKGFFVVTGCAHPGLDVILDAAGEFGLLYGVLGGFHGFDKYDALTGLDLIVPCHCTQHKKEIMDLFPDNTIFGGAGYRIEL
ncbi:MAG: MBL fold hydrolase [Candidatus Altiarchaeales archaeon ex4484_96]|nr:MAG: MBL fold hydrolase [Candidatus Altiarchaeales archaeon ex4484_96]